MAQDIFSVPASSVPCKRAFSGAKHIDTDNWSCLMLEHLGAIQIAMGDMFEQRNLQKEQKVVAVQEGLQQWHGFRLGWNAFSFMLAMHVMLSWHNYHFPTYHQPQPKKKLVQELVQTRIELFKNHIMVQVRFRLQFSSGSQKIAPEPNQTTASLFTVNELGS